MTTIDPNVVDTHLAQGLRERAVDLGDEDRFYQQVLATITVMPQRRWIRRWPAGFGRRTSLVLVAAALVTLLAMAAGVGAFLRSHPTPPIRPGDWSDTGTMIDGHALHTATLLADGTVLIAGVPTGPRMNHAELYDPASGSWTATGNMSSGPLRSHGDPAAGWQGARGGRYRQDDVGLASAEVYDPGTRTWTATASMIHARDGHTATLLPDGRVLVAGGGVRDHHRAVRPSQRNLDRHRDHGQGSPLPGGHAAARWQGTRRGRLLRRRGIELRRAVRPEHRDVDRDRVHDSRYLGRHSHAAARWHGPLRRRARVHGRPRCTTLAPGSGPRPGRCQAFIGRPRPRCCRMARCSSRAGRPGLRGTVRPVQQDVGCHREHGRGPSSAHGHAPAEWRGAHGGRVRSSRSDAERSAELYHPGTGN